jgi:tetratricopeptide (TPR) repeat protein
MRLALAVAFAVAGTGVARADDISKADDLFRAARAMLETDPDGACKLFEQALTLNPHSTGILLNAALCDEKAGRIASATDRYEEAARVAREQNMSCNGCAKEEVAVAEQRRDKLLPDVPHVRILLADDLPDTRILVDGKQVSVDRARRDLRIDPGSRTIEVAAPGRVTYKTTVVLARREKRDIHIPVLAFRTVKSSKKLIGRITLLGGGVAVTTSVVLGWIAKGRYDQAFDDGLCNMNLECLDAGHGAVKRAQTLGNVGSVVGVAGLVAIGVGSYLWATAPKPRQQDEGPSKKTKRRVTLVPHVGPEHTGFALVGEL